MKRQTLVFTLAAVLLTATLWAAKIRTDWDHDANFDDYQTYMWKGGNALPNPLMEQRVISAIESELSAKGIQKVEADPDMQFPFDTFDDMSSDSSSSSSVEETTEVVEVIDDSAPQQ